MSGTGFALGVISLSPASWLEHYWTSLLPGGVTSPSGQMTLSIACGAVIQQLA